MDADGLQAITATVARSRLLAGARVEVLDGSPQIRGLAYRLGWERQLPAVDGLESYAVEPGSGRDDDPATPGPLGCDEVRWPESAVTAPEAVIATDLSGTVIHWNREAHRLYGWSPTEVSGRSITELTVQPGDEALARHILATVRRHGAWEGGFEVRRRDLTSFQAHVRNTIIEDGLALQPALSAVPGACPTPTAQSRSRRP